MATKSDSPSSPSDFLAGLRSKSIDTDSVSGHVNGLPRHTPVASWAAIALSVVVAGTYSNIISGQVG